jgi:uncharacterized protein (TIGR03437 family)
LVPVAVTILVCGATASAQLVTNVGAIPRTGKPPVVFVNGYQNSCSGTTFQGTFGSADQVLQGDARASVFFDSCKYGDNHPPIEDLGNKLGEFLRSLKYDNGETVPQVDIVTHSMGGLIVRSYLAGKQTQEGVFTPPADTKVRKIIFLATPHFGSPATTLLGGVGGNAQTDELKRGSTFVFDLATWNQGIDDLRGIDAISVLGNTSNSTAELLGIMKAGFGDGVTTLTSGSLAFAAAERTRIIPYCHTDVAAPLCSSAKGNIAEINSPDHDSARIILSFLNSTPDWRAIGQAAEQNMFLAKQGGLFVRSRNANDQLQTPLSVRIGNDTLSLAAQIAYTELVSVEQPIQLSLALPTGVSTATVTLPPTTTRAITIKPGPSIDGIFPSFAAITPRSVAPGSLISIYGRELTAATGDLEVNVAGQRVPVGYAGATQINTLVPLDAAGLVKLQVKNGAGEQTVNLFVEPVVPAVFPSALNAVNGALITQQSPIHPGEYVALFVTGMGATTLRDGLNWANVQPEVTVGGQPCAVTFAGRAPGYEGLDQINCQLPVTLQPGDTQVIVRSASRSANVITLPVR